MQILHTRLCRRKSRQCSTDIRHLCSSCRHRWMKLTRHSLFSQTSEEAFLYMTPSLNIAFNKDLEKDQEKAGDCIGCLDCMISEEGQRLIANGRCVISLNTNVPTMMQDISGLEDEMKSNSIYIRYSAQKILSCQSGSYSWFVVRRDG